MNKMSQYQYEHASLLLPWYITGQLSVSERDEVESILEMSPILQRELEQQQSIARMISGDPDILDIVAIRTQEQRLDSLLERINNDQEELNDGLNKSTSSWVYSPLRILSHAWSRLDDFLQPLTNHWVRIAFSLFVVTQVVILGTILNKSNESANGGFTLAGDNEPYVPSQKATLIFHFSEQVESNSINQLFQEIGSKVISHPEGSKSYTVVLLNKLNDQEIDSLVQRLERKKQMILLVSRGL